MEAIRLLTTHDCTSQREAIRTRSIRTAMATAKRRAAPYGNMAGKIAVYVEIAEYDEYGFPRVERLACWDARYRSWDVDQWLVRRIEWVKA